MSNRQKHVVEGAEGFVTEAARPRGWSPPTTAGQAAGW